MADLGTLQRKNPRFVIGLMSGTSSDGIDAVLVRLKGGGENLAMKLIAHRAHPYNPGLREQLLAEHKTAKEVCLLNFEVGERLAEAALDMIKVAAEENITPDFIASHGHTVGHYPPPRNTRIGTLQIGEPAIIAERTGLPVVSDFRPRDMAAGGQGAPLVPYADWHLFRRLNRTIACLNIGGISNFTVVTPDFNEILAFDTGPGNMAIDGAVRLLTRGKKNMDRDGRAAAKGEVIDEFLEYLLGHNFFSKVPPKSTGREEFGEEIYLRDALASRRDFAYEDLVATVTTAVVKSIADAFNRFIKPVHDVDHLIVAGGGTMNATLMEWLERELAPLPVYTSEQYGIPNAAREAIAFAILGNETIGGNPSNVPQATGASHPVILGKITPA
jgi:anhydro-N-acetylmuramic acid kinase